MARSTRDGETIQAQYRPIEPATSLDVTQADPDTGTLTKRRTAC